MSIPVEHLIKLFEIERADPSNGPKFRVSCSCQWEGWAHTRAVAEKWIGCHAWAQTIRGNIVSIDRGNLPEFKPQAEAGGVPKSA